MMYRLLHPGALSMLGRSAPVATSLLVVSVGVFAQASGADAGPKRGLTIVPRVAVTETVTDNVRLGGVGKRADFITEISPGIRVNVDGARVKGYLNYALNEVIYARNSSSGRTQNALNALGTVEAIEKWAFLDFSGNISQQSVSAFGTQSVDNTSINPNRTEVASYRISPYVQGQFGAVANYEARYSRAETSSTSATASDVTTDDAVVRVSGSSAFKSLGWTADASHQRIDFSAGRDTEADRFGLGVVYNVTPQFNLLANAGREANNFTSINKQNKATSGFGLNWSSSNTTRFSAARDHRSFGNTHQLSFEHRTARTAWKIVDSKNVSTTPNQTGIGSLGPIFDLLFNQFASVEPDPVLRARLVEAFLQANGIDPNAVVVSSFLTSALTLQRRQEVSFALLGVRDTITVIASRSNNRRLDTVISVVDDFSASSKIRQHGFSVNYAHRLTPDYSLGVLVSQQKSFGDTSLQDVRLRSLRIHVAGRVARQAAVSLGLRHVISTGTSSYNESAILGSLTVQF